MGGRYEENNPPSNAHPQPHAPDAARQAPSPATYRDLFPRSSPSSSLRHASQTEPQEEVTIFLSPRSPGEMRSDDVPILAVRHRANFWRAIALGALSGLVVVATALVFVLLRQPQVASHTTSAAVCTPVSDALIGGLGKQWQFVNPRGDASVGFGTQGMTLNTPPFHDLWATSNQNAPRVLQTSATEGNFTVQVHISATPPAYIEGAGIVIWQDDNNFLRLEMVKWSANTPSVGLFQEVDGTPITVVTSGAVLPAQAQLTLRLQRLGDQFQALYVPDGGLGWQVLGSTSLAFGSVRVGMYSIDEPWQNTKPTPLQATFSAFKLMCLAGG